MAKKKLSDILKEKNKEYGIDYSNEPIQWTDWKQVREQNKSNPIGYIASNFGLGASRSVQDTITSLPQSYAVGLQRGAKQSEQEQSTWDYIKNLGKNIIKTGVTNADTTGVGRLWYYTTIGKEDAYKDLVEPHLGIAETTYNNLLQQASQVQNPNDINEQWKFANKMVKQGGAVAGALLSQEGNPLLQSIYNSGQVYGQAWGKDKANKQTESIMQFDENIHKGTDKWAEDLAKEGENQNKLVSLLGEGSQTIGYMTPGILTSLASGGASASTQAGIQAGNLALMGLSAKSSATREGLKQGLDLETAETRGVGTGTKEAATEMMWSGVAHLGKIKSGGIEDSIKNWIGKTIDSNFTNKATQKIFKGVGNWLVDVTGETAEELVADIYDTWLDQATVDPNKQYTLNDALHTAIGTIISTTGMNGGYKALNLSQQALSNVLNRNQTRVENKESIPQTERAESNNYKANVQEIINNVQLPEQMKQQYQQMLDSDATVNEEEYNNIKNAIKEQVKANTEAQSMSVMNTTTQQYEQLEQAKQNLDNIKPEDFKDAESRKFYAQQINKEFDSTIMDNILPMYPENRNGRRTVKQYKEIATQYGKAMAENGLSFDDVRANTVGAWQYYEPSKNITRYDNQQKQNQGFEKLNSQVWSQLVYDSYKNTMKTQIAEQQKNLQANMESQVQAFKDEYDTIIDTIDNLGKQEQNITEEDNLITSAEKYGYNSKDISIENLQKLLDKRNIKGRFDASKFTDNNIGAYYNYYQNEDGSYTREVVINPNASEKAIIQELAMHEVMHDIIASNTITSQELYNDIVDHVKNHNQDEYNKVRENLDKSYREAFKDKGEDYFNSDEYQKMLDEESVTKVMEIMTGTQERVNRLVNDNRNLAQKFYDFIKDKIDSLIHRNDAEYMFWKDIQKRFDKAFNETEFNPKESKGIRFANKVLSNNQAYTELDVDLSNLTTKERNEYLAEYLGSLNGKTIKTEDGTTIKFIDILKNIENGKDKNLVKELIRSNTKYKNIDNRVELKQRILANIDENLEISQKNKTKEDVDGRHKDLDITSFDTRKGIVYDGNNFYKVYYDIANLNNGDKVAYAIKSVSPNNSLKQFLNKKELDSYVSSKEDKLGLPNSTDNSLPQPDKNVNKKFSIATDGSMIDNKGNKVTLDAETGSTDKTLLAIHNLNEDKLRGVLELGGFPVPSIAISNPNTVPHSEFGDISVVFDKETINPANRKNEVYDRDVWSPTFPSVNYDINNADIKKYVSNNLDLDHSDPIINDAILDYFYQENLGNKVERYGLDKTLDIIKESKPMKYLYLTQIDKSGFKPIMKQANFSNSNDYTNLELQRFLNEYKGNKPLNELTYDEIIGLQNHITKIIEDHLIEEANNLPTKKYQEKYKEYIKEIISKYNDNYNLLNNFVYSANSMQTKGANSQIIDESKTLSYVDDAINQKEFEEWVDNTFGEMFNNAKKGIRNDKELFTPSGNRRSFNQLYDEYNLTNIVKALTKGNTKGGQESSIFGVGFGRISAQTSKRFNSISDIKNNENRLMTRQQAEEIIRPISEDLFTKIDEVVDYYKIKNYDSDTVNRMQGADLTSEIVEEFAGGSLTEERFRKLLSEYNSYDIEKIPSSLLNGIIEDLKQIKNLPTDYFEAKPQRAVGFDEIDTVVLPSDTSEDIKQQLKDRGIEYIEYDKNNKEARSDILKALDEYKFSKEATNFDDFLRNTYGKYAEQGTKTTLGELRKNLPTKQKATRSILPTQQNDTAKLPTRNNEVTLEDYLTHEPNYYDGDQFDYDSHRTDIIRQANQDIVNIVENSNNVKEALQKAYEENEQSEGNNNTLETGLDEDNRLTYQHKESMLSSLLREGNVKNSEIYKAIYDDVKTATNLPTKQPILPTTKKTQTIQQNKAEKTTANLPIQEDTITVPLETNENRLPSQKQRKAYQSIIESPVMSDEAKKVARKYIGQDTYVPDSNKAQLERADKLIEINGVEDSLNSLEKKAIKGDTIKAEDIAIGDRLIQYYSLIGDGENLQKAVRAVALAGTQAGRSVQAFNLLRHQTPQGMVVWIKNSVDKLNLKTKNGQFDFTPEMQQKIASSTEENLQQNVDEVMKELGQQVPVDTIGKIDAWRYFSMLANPKTHIRNIVGNFAMGLTQQVSNKIAGTIEQVTGQDRTHTSIFEKRSKENIQFAKEDLKNVTAQLGMGENKYANPKNQIQKNQRTFKSDTLEKTLGKLYDLNDNLLEGEDNFGLKNAYIRCLSDYMTANKLKPSTITNEQLQQARKIAINNALEATFHQESSLASMLNQFENKNSLTRLVVGGLVPFKKTPINVAKGGFNYSPVGLAKSIVYDTVELRKGNINANQYIDNISKGLTGTGIAFLGYALAEAGILKASGDDDKEDKYKQAMGEQPYSIMINGKSYSLDWLAPTGIPLFVGAELNKLVHDTTEKEGETENEVLKAMGRITDATASLLNPMSEMSMISGLTSTIQSFSQDSGQALMNLLVSPMKSYVGQFVPTALGQVARTADKYERDTSSTETGLLPKAIDTTKNQIMNKIPGLRQMLPTKKDIWGEEIETQDYFHNAVLPYTKKEIKTNPVDKELNDLYEKTGENIYPNTSLSKTVTYEGSKTRLTNQDYNDFKTNYGKTSYKLLDSLISSKEYSGMTDEQKVKAVKDVYTYANNLNKTEYAEKKGIDFKVPSDVKQVRSIKANGGTESDYFKYKGLTDGLSKESEKMTALKDSSLSAKSKRAVYISTIGSDDTFYQNTNIGINDYLGYKTADIQGVKDSSGKTISGSVKQAQLDYINKNISGYENRLLLMGKNYKLSRSQQQDLANYINTLDNAEDLFNELSKNFTVSNGTVYYK